MYMYDVINIQVNIHISRSMTPHYWQLYSDPL